MSAEKVKLALCSKQQIESYISILLNYGNVLQYKKVNIQYLESSIGCTVFPNNYVHKIAVKPPPLNVYSEVSLSVLNAVYLPGKMQCTLSLM